MPIYAYRCEACGHAKDVLQKVSDPLLTICPSCGAEAFKKQVTAAGFQLKGSGWYVTDFRGDSKAGKPAVEGATSAKGEGGKTEPTPTDAGKSESGAADKSKSEPSPGKSDSAGAKATAGPAPAAAPASGSGSGGAGSAAGGQ